MLVLLEVIEMTDTMEGRTVMITGANTGIGLATAHQLALMGAKIVFVGRDEQGLKDAMRDVMLSTGNEDMDFLVADLSSMSQVRRLAREILDRYDRLDVLINNAGVITKHREVTVDGFERDLAVNHLAPFLLTNMLLDLMVASGHSRIVNLSSSAHRFSRLDFDDLQYEKGWSSMRSYGTTKLMNILFTRALAKRLDGTSVTVNAVHPGFVSSCFGRDFNPVSKGLTKIFAKSTKKGARTSVYLASSPEVDGVTGRYFANEKEGSVSKTAQDDELAERLWWESERLTGIKTGEIAIERAVCEVTTIC